MSAADQIAWDVFVIIVFVAAGGVLGWLVRSYMREAVMRWQTRHEGSGRTEWTGAGPVTVDSRPPSRSGDSEGDTDQLVRSA